MEKYQITNDHIVNQPYYDYLQPYNQNIFKLIDSRLKNIDPEWYNKKILDFGCNVGNLLRSSDGKIKKYVGVDVQQAPLNIAKKEFSNQKWILYNGYHPAFNRTGTEKFPDLNKEKYDYIICIGVFTHCDLNQIENFILEFKKHLTENGRIIFSLWEHTHWELYTKVFLYEKFKIVLPSDVFKEFHKCIYLIDRSISIVDCNSLPIQECTWVETFYNRNFILEYFPDIKVLEGPYSKHTIYIL